VDDWGVSSRLDTKSHPKESRLFPFPFVIFLVVVVEALFGIDVVAPAAAVSSVVLAVAAAVMLMLSVIARFELGSRNSWPPESKFFR